MNKFIKHIFTGIDGETWAIGRVASAPTLLSGLSVPFVMLVQGQEIDLSALGVFYGGLAGGVSALIGLTNHTEPKEGS
jgi:hypothetical protein